MDQIALGSGKPILAGIFYSNLPKTLSLSIAAFVNIPSTLSTGWNKLTTRSRKE